MKKISFAKISPLGLALISVSAIISALITPEKNSDQIHIDRNGEGFPSSARGEETVLFVEGGNRSWTATGIPGNEDSQYSATSNNDLGTCTYNVGCHTGNGTTGVEDESLCE